MFTGRAVTADRAAPDHVRVSAHRHGGRLARLASVAALAAVLLVPTAAAEAAPSRTAVAADETPAPTGPADDGETTANDGGGDGRITFGISTAAGGQLDSRGVITIGAPAGAVVYEQIAAVNLSDAPLDVDLYAVDVVNAEDGALAPAPRGDPRELTGAWLTLDAPAVHVPAQSGATGPGVVVVPVTIAIPEDAEPGDHLGMVFASVTAAGRAEESAPTVDLEHRVGIRVYVAVQGQVRAGLTVTNLHATFTPGSAFGKGTIEVTYTVTNDGNLRFGVESSVRGTGLFGMSATTADAPGIEELLPHASVRQKVTLENVFPFIIENLAVSATAVPSPNAEDPGIGTVTASTWLWLWSWLYVVILALIAALVGWYVQRKRARRPGTWGPPQAVWGDGHGPSTPPTAPAEPPSHGASAQPPGHDAPAPVGGGSPGHGAGQPGSGTLGGPGGHTQHGGGR